MNDSRRGPVNWASAQQRSSRCGQEIAWIYTATTKRTDRGRRLGLLREQRRREGPGLAGVGRSVTAPFESLRGLFVDTGMIEGRLMSLLAKLGRSAAENLNSKPEEAAYSLA